MVEGRLTLICSSQILPLDRCTLADNLRISRLGLEKYSMQFRFRRTRIFVAFVLLLVFVEAAGLLLHPARADSYGTANARLFYDSNVSNADETDDIRSDSGLDFGVTSATLYDLESLGLLRISGSFDGASYARYVGLDHLGLAGDLALKR
jgi:hypothetical protein